MRGRELLLAEQAVAQHIPQPGTEPGIEVQRAARQLDAGGKVPQLQAHEFGHLAQQPPVARAAGDGLAVAFQGGVLAARLQVHAGLMGRGLEELLRVGAEAVEKGCRRALASLADQDRKSTRLNSSHSQISYAVFCLKKKKKHNIVD